MLETRATPDEILKKIEQEELAASSGHLKIFFGYAAGVGKTYAMLAAAHVAKQQKTDVVAGYIEPHTRPQTMELLDGLEKLPPLEISHKNITLKEFNLDAAIKRNPQLILVDELAHTNAEGCRHLKRYQDIKELLAAGIDVYTTVNVQHIESLNDIVASITGIIVRERIPDSVFDEATQVELVDIEPEDLIERLNEGKIYKPAQAQKALGHFFSTENLIALREIALRRTADRVNKLSEKAKQSSNGNYYTDEHILACLSSSPTNMKIIRTAARMANAFKGEFTALFVVTPSFETMSDENKKRLNDNIRLAEQLGAKIETVYGEDVASPIAEFARLSGVSKVVVGRSNTRRKFGIGNQSFSERLISFAPNLDIYIIPDQSTPAYIPQKVKQKQSPFLIQDVVKSLLILSAATLTGSFFHQVGFSEANIITIYILGVLITSILTSSRRYSIISSVLSVLIFNFFFTEPRYTFSAYDSGYPITFLVMFLAAFLTGSLTTKIKWQAKQSAQTAYRTKVLLDTNQLLQQQKEKEGITRVISGQLMKLLQKDIVFYSPDEEKLSEPRVFSVADGEENKAAYITDNEKAVAQWVYKNNKHAGATTNTLGDAKCLYLAVRGSGAVYGVVGIALREDSLDSFEKSLVLSMLGECALALERDSFGRKRAAAALQAKNEQLRANLLRSISHDLRTPLTGIFGNAGVLLNNEETLDKEKRKQLYADIYDDSTWLINLVENLLSVTRIEDGTMKIHTEAELIEEVITEALRHINRKSIEHTISVSQSEDFIMAVMDARLIVQVIINIVDNAIKYTPYGSDIVIRAAKKDSMVVVEIADNGDGISDEAKERIFEMFYTANSTLADSRRSLGLGLALCKSIITAHGGNIEVGDNFPHGTKFRFTLPAKEVTLHE